MYKVVLLRHGQSEWNKLNLFTGWQDVDLTEQGVQEAREAGRVMKEEGFKFDVAYTSVMMYAHLSSKKVTSVTHHTTAVMLP